MSYNLFISRKTIVSLFHLRLGHNRLPRPIPPIISPYTILLIVHTTMTPKNVTVVIFTTYADVLLFSLLFIHFILHVDNLFG